MGSYAPLISLIVPGLALVIVVLVYAKRRVGAPSARTLGRAYSVSAKIAGWVGAGELVIREGALRYSPALAPGHYIPPPFHGIRVPLERLRAVHVRDVGIAVDYEGLEGLETLVFVTREQGAKDRLLWELAVVAPAAVEAGLTADGARAAGPTPLTPTGRAAPTGDTPDGARAVSDLDARMTTLGSALAGPADRVAPPPPRSGLGTGLFVAPPRDGDG